MKPIAPLAMVVAALVLLLTITPSWGQPTCAAPGCNPTVTDGNENTAGGTNALVNVVTSGASQGFNNTAFGFDALEDNTSGGNNTATGSGALRLNTTGFENTATGLNALGFNSTGYFNTASGSSALASNDTGNSNTATGFGALLNNTVGNNNTAVGFKALKKSLGTRTSASGTRQASPS